MNKTQLLKHSKGILSGLTANQEEIDKDMVSLTSDSTKEAPRTLRPRIARTKQKLDIDTAPTTGYINDPIITKSRKLVDLNQQRQQLRRTLGDLQDNIFAAEEDIEQMRRSIAFFKQRLCTKRSEFQRLSVVLKGFEENFNEIPNDLKSNLDSNFNEKNYVIKSKNQNGPEYFSESFLETCLKSKTMPDELKILMIEILKIMVLKNANNSINLPIKTKNSAQNSALKRNFEKMAKTNTVEVDSAEIAKFPKSNSNNFLPPFSNETPNSFEENNKIENLKIDIESISKPFIYKTDSVQSNLNSHNLNSNMAQKLNDNPNAEIIHKIKEKMANFNFDRKKTNFDAIISFLQSVDKLSNAVLSNKRLKINSDNVKDQNGQNEQKIEKTINLEKDQSKMTKITKNSTKIDKIAKSSIFKAKSAIFSPKNQQKNSPKKIASMPNILNSCRKFDRFDKIENKEFDFKIDKTYQIKKLVKIKKELEELIKYAESLFKMDFDQNIDYNEIEKLRESLAFSNYHNFQLANNIKLLKEGHSLFKKKLEKLELENKRLKGKITLLEAISVESKKAKMRQIIAKANY